MPNITDSKCILIIGATAGIGRDLALKLQILPSKPKVIVSGRRRERLDELAKEGLDTIRANIDVDRATLKQFVDKVVGKYPELDTVIFCAGIQNEFDFSKPESVDLDIFISELNTNYISIITMIRFFLPHLLQRGSEGQPCFLIPVSSSLALVPGSWVPCYSAIKAALHSYSISLNEQLKGSGVNVIEIIPPLVESELHDHQGKSAMYSKIWLPLDEFTKNEVEGLLRGDSCIAVGVAGEWHQQFDKDKAETAHKMYVSRQKMES